MERCASRSPLGLAEKEIQKINWPYQIRSLFSKASKRSLFHSKITNTNNRDPMVIRVPVIVHFNLKDEADKNAS
ncbi:hypothetical protein SAMN04488055_5392 [Chitinophaga niabensis]|uniref:Uncharacterized protein n=1 Tax=Chitinophaga niabensis TaxID=536979 RepID=A0A1N6K9U3_9BACT|nr:hypothetical protein SAMN04488055_5392 [Chitinophaga niabensis]